MSGQLGELVISLAADTARFRADLGKATKATQDASRDMSAHFDKMGAAVKTTIGLMAGLAGVASLGSLVKGSIDAADNMSKMSQKVGVAIDQLSGMAYAASLADVSTEQLGKGMGKLAKLMYEAAGDKNGGPAETFRTLGVSVTDAAGKLRGTDSVMMDVADRLAGMDDGAAKTAIAMEVFGKAGADLIPLLNGGKKGIQEAADEAKRFGLILTEEAGKQAEEFNDNLTRMGSQATGAAMALVNELAPAVLQLMDGLSKGDGLNTSPLISFISGIGGVIRNTQREAVSMIATFDKMAAWVNTGGSLRHLINKKDAAEYARRIQVINEAKDAAIKDIYEPEAKPEAAKRKGSGAGASGKAKTVDAAALLAEKRKEAESFRDAQIEEGARLIELQQKISEEFRENQIEEGVRLLELKQAEGEAFRENQIEEGARLLELKEQQARRVKDFIAGMGINTKAAKGDYQGVQSDVLKEQQESRREWIEKEISDNDEKNAALLASDRLYAAQKAELTETSWMAVGGMVSNQLGQMAGMMDKANADQFAAYKAMMIAQATIATSMAIVGILAAESKLGMLAIPLAFTAGAIGLAQVAMIAAQPQPQARALGGPVTAGQTYIVNENRATQGPEYFTPGVSGTITPANKMGGNSGPQVTQVIQMSPGLAGTVQAEIMRLMPLLKQQAVQAVQQAQRGGQLQRV